jgi:P4 family phage/plasmid primase-like protien
VVYRGKELLVKTYTGYQGGWPSDEQVQRRISASKKNRRRENIALRLPHGVIGIDVDDYNDKGGGATLADLVERFGALPKTMRSSSRGFEDDEASGIRFYRVGEDDRFGGKAGKGIEIIQFHHRYAIVAPSIHPQGREYRWFDERTGELLDDVSEIRVEDLPELPSAWIEGLKELGRIGEVKSLDEAGLADPEAVKTFLGELRDGSECRYVERLSERLGESAARERGAAHDEVLRDVLALIEAGYQGHRGVGAALRDGRAAFVAGVADRSSEAGAKAEWRRMTRGGLAMKLAAGEKMASICVCDEPAKMRSDPANPFGAGVVLTDEELSAAKNAERADQNDGGGGEAGSGEGGSGAGGGSDGGSKPTAGKPTISAFAGPVDVDRFFDPDTGLRVDLLIRDVLNAAPAALTPEGRIAIYAGGVYRVDGERFNVEVSARLRNRFRQTHLKNAEIYARARLYAAGKELPVHSPFPMVNVANGMVDLLTGELKDWSPDYKSMMQLPVSWNPEAVCPRYEAWVEAVGIAGVIEDLEEVCSTMLDPSRTPAKAAFLFGPSRSGKSTYLRIMAAIAGVINTSAVTLHQLSENRFAAANIYGKILNSAADLSDAHVQDLSVFKMMTGEDPIHGDRKYGNQFVFTNRALFMFSANTLPTVSEDSRAYAERVKPFRFDRSFAGHEDPEIETAIMQELPGVLRRLVAAWQRRTGRGHYLPTAQDVQQDFDTKSNRVYEWFTEECTLWPLAETATAEEPKVPVGQASSKKDLAHKFNAWASENEMSRLGPKKIIERLTCIDGVREVRFGDDKRRGLNVTVRPDETWG